MPVRRFERTGRVRNEALDCLVYCFSARQAVSINLERRAAELRNQPIDRPSIASQLAGYGVKAQPIAASIIGRRP
jgi:phage terminase large subunit GpA-like protein